MYHIQAIRQVMFLFSSNDGFMIPGHRPGLKLPGAVNFSSLAVPRAKF
jgi:hypothetical protein